MPQTMKYLPNTYQIPTKYPSNTHQIPIKYLPYPTYTVNTQHTCSRDMVFVECVPQKVWHICGTLCHKCVTLLYKIWEGEKYVPQCGTCVAQELYSAIFDLFVGV